MSIMRRLVSILARKKFKQMEGILNAPIEHTEKKLFEIIECQQSTQFGKEYDFQSIHNIEEWADCIPLSTHQSRMPYLQRIYENPDCQALTMETPFAYLQTSGTTGKPKHLPFTVTACKEVSQASMHTLMAFMMADKENPKILDGTLLVFGAPIELNRINGIPVGYATGVYASRQNPIFQRLMKPGKDIFNLMDMDDKMREYAKIVATERITALQGITTLSLALLRRLQNQYGSLLQDVTKGTKHEARIKRAVYDDGKVDVAELMPDLRLFYASGIDTDPYREWIKKTLPNVTIWDIYGGSEGVYAGQMYEDTKGMQLIPQLTYFEFIRERDCEKPNPEVIPLSEVKRGFRYEIVITNKGGYYRYRNGDIVTFGDTDPYTIHSISRKGRVVNLSGEKLSEAHVSDAIAFACSKTSSEVMDYSVIGLVEEGIPKYVIAAMFRERTDPREFVLAFEEGLKSSNEEFRVVRETGALGATTLHRMTRSHFEDVVKSSHIQAKPISLTTDTKVLESCEVLV
ncbi:MAG: hypothetical protein BAJATHORv1_40138 [Candidatus Thorarchaeota archaeon]|nr:MAG: hypothetical protein BAJATHORv1_40138 [Candidatus Thorarchaeota archaeon]